MSEALSEDELKDLQRAADVLGVPLFSLLVMRRTQASMPQANPALQSNFQPLQGYFDPNFNHTSALPPSLPPAWVAFDLRPDSFLPLPALQTAQTRRFSGGKSTAPPELGLNWISFQAGQPLQSIMPVDAAAIANQAIHPAVHCELDDTWATFNPFTIPAAPPAIAGRQIKSPWAAGNGEHDGFGGPASLAAPSPFDTEPFNLIPAFQCDVPLIDSGNYEQRCQEFTSEPLGFPAATGGDMSPDDTIAPYQSIQQLEAAVPAPDLGTTSACPSSPLAKARYHKPSRSRLKPAGGRPHGKRKRYSDAERLQTSQTRKTGSCMRCRMNRKRCIPDPSNPNGPCLGCQKMVFDYYGLPCLRYKITDCNLFKDTGHNPYESVHMMTGPRFGDFHLQKTWTSPEIRAFDLSQGRGTVLRFRVRRFKPPEAGEHFTDNKNVRGMGRKFFAIPWAIAKLDEAIEAVDDFISRSVPVYIESFIRTADPLVRLVFRQAQDSASGSRPNTLVCKALRFWTSARFLEGGWRCAGDDKLGAELLSPPWRAKENVALPPYLDFQFAAILGEMVLGPLSREILRELEDLMLKKSPSSWLTIFLIVFILMQSYESILSHEVNFTTRRRYLHKYFDMKLIRGYLSGSKILLAHFHVVNKGNVPFHPDFDWTLPANHHMAELTNREVDFVKQVRSQVNKRAQDLVDASTTHHYDTPFWFIGQLFDTSWEPRETCEHSPQNSFPLGPET